MHILRSISDACLCLCLFPFHSQTTPFSWSVVATSASIARTLHNFHPLGLLFFFGCLSSTAFVILMRCPDFIPCDGRYLGPQSPLVLYSIPDGKVRVQGGSVVLVVRVFLDTGAIPWHGSFAFLSLSLSLSSTLSLSSSFSRIYIISGRCDVYAVHQTCAPLKSTLPTKLAPSRTRWMRFDQGMDKGLQWGGNTAGDSHRTVCEKTVRCRYSNSYLESPVSSMMPRIVSPTTC
jgi:hypothetical protein